MDELKKAVALWADMFRDDNVSVVAAAVKSLIASDVKGFPPVIGQVKAKIRFLTELRTESEMEAWQTVLKAVRVSSYGARKEFDAFPPLLKRIVGSPDTLREWAAMDADKLHTVVASNFQRSYRAISEREREVNALPPKIKDVVSRIGDKEKTQTTAKRIDQKQPIEGKSIPIPEETKKAIRLAFGGIKPPVVAGEMEKQKRSKEDVLRYLKGE